ncbi:MAG: mercuric transporter MerT family protein [Burkholderiales bacterium]
MNSPTPESSSLAAGILAALGASSCCLLPLVLVSVGISGAWIAQLRALERFFPALVLVAIGAFAFAFYRLYLQPAPCEGDAACADPRVRRRQRIAFWVTLAAAHALVLSPYYAAHLLG